MKRTCLVMLVVVVAAIFPSRVCLAGEAFSWQQQQARTTSSGDLKWSPGTFVYRPGEQVRYIDFQAGSDDNSGTSRRDPWKHHPWDPEATGKAKACSQADTFVFKRGVIYRGRLIADRSGTAGTPIQLTSDPSWGGGEACLFGSRRIEGPWKRAGSAPTVEGLVRGPARRLVSRGALADR